MEVLLLKISMCMSLKIGVWAAILLFGFWSPAAQQKKAAGSESTSAKTVNLDRTKAGPVTRPHIANIANNTYCINEFGIDSQYVLIGTTRAMLLDTGTGFYDIKATVGKLTNLPYDVVITHVGADHGGMIGNFEIAYLHPADLPAVSEMSVQKQKEAAEKMWNTPLGYKDLWGYTPADCRWAKFDKLPTIKPLSDGQTFDLGGGRILTVYHLPGHTPGNCVLLDHKERILFSSDIIYPEYRSKSTPISTQLRGYLKLRDLRPKYDRMYGGHTAMGGTLDVLPLDPEYLDDLIEICRQLLRGEARLEKSGRNTYAVG
jgi:hydroxyacylglutathione hydrolase